MWQDIVITQRTYETTIKGTYFNGYIQTISRYPIVVHMHTEEQLLLVRKLQSNDLTLHLDATGSIVRKIDKFHKRIMYYALVAIHPEAQISPLPLAEMLTNEQTNVEITHNIVIHICSAHIMHRFSYKIERKLLSKPPKETKRFLMFVMARLISCTSLDEMDQLFTSLCMLCFSRVRYPEIEKYFDKIENAVQCNSEENYELELEYIPQMDEKLPNEMGDSISYRKKSPFGQHYDSILNKCYCTIQSLETLSKNTPIEENRAYYCPNLPEYLVTHYMPICPLWTGLIIGPSKFPGKANATFTNSIAENWMRIVKKNILNEESKLRPGDFIRRMYDGISRRIKAFEFAFHPISCKVMKKTKIGNSRIIDDSQIEKNWERRKKSRGYFKSYKISRTRRSKPSKCGRKGVSNSKSHKKNLKCLETIPLKNLSGHSQKFDQIEISSAVYSIMQSRVDHGSLFVTHDPSDPSYT